MWISARMTQPYQCPLKHLTCITCCYWIRLNRPKKFKSSKPNSVYFYKVFNGSIYFASSTVLLEDGPTKWIRVKRVWAYPHTQPSFFWNLLNFELEEVSQFMNETMRCIFSMYILHKNTDRASHELNRVREITSSSPFLVQVGAIHSHSEQIKWNLPLSIVHY